MNISGISYFNIQTAGPLAATRQLATSGNPVASATSYGAPEPAGNDGDIGTYDSFGKLAPISDSFVTSQPNGFEIYMPVRLGFSSNNLALAVTDPAAEPFSSGKTKTEVAEAARKAIDSRYAQMSGNGQPFGYNSHEGKDWYSALGDLDRRALNAMRTDTTGLFSKEEKDMAASIMANQQGLAMGLYAGPIRLAETFVSDPSNHMAVGKAGALWLDKVSYEEKTTSIEWMEQRAATQRLYEHGAEHAGVEPEDLSSGFSFVDMLLQAYKDLEQLGEGYDLKDVPAYQKAFELFANYAPAKQQAASTLYL